MRSLFDRLAQRRVQPGTSPTSAPVRAEAEAWTREAPQPVVGTKRSAVLVCHGFTGSPVSINPWAEHLSRLGHSVAVPRLPGHGTAWQELNHISWLDWYACVEQCLLDLADEHELIFVAGLSMGGALALRLAEEHPDLVTGLALVNPAIASRDPRMRLTGVLRRVISSIPSIGNDIAKPGRDEASYERTPIGGVDEMTKLWAVTRRDLPAVTAPLLLFRSLDDHVVDSLSAELILANVSSDIASERLLHRSYHVATLDHDAPDIFAESASFFADLAEAAVSTPRSRG